MPRKTKTGAPDQAALPQIPAELLEKLIPGPVTPGQLEDIFQQFKKAFIQQALGAEMSHHLGYAPGQAKPEGVTNHHVDQDADHDNSTARSRVRVRPRDVDRQWPVEGRRGGAIRAS